MLLLVFIGWLAFEVLDDCRSLACIGDGNRHPRAADHAAGRRERWSVAGQRYANLQLLLADHVVCANERQRDSYIGALGALGRRALFAS